MDESGLTEDGRTIPLAEELPPEPADELPPEPLADAAAERRAFAEAFRRRQEEREQPKQEELTGHNGRSRKFDLRCSEEEVARWESAALTEGVTTSEFLRLAADQRAEQLVS